MNLYRMTPAQPQFDWFERNKSKGTMYYDCGERLAEFENDKTVRWYYRNGRPALEYYEAEGLYDREQTMLLQSKYLMLFYLLLFLYQRRMLSSALWCTAMGKQTTEAGSTPSRYSPLSITSGMA